MIDGPRGRPGYTYTEKDWNPITEDEAIADPIMGYRGAKTFAERAAWDFVQTEKVNFSLAVICPPTVYGPVAYSLSSLEGINTSNERIRDTIQGKYKDAAEISGASIWADVRDVAAAHILAAEKDAAAGQRFFVTAGFFTNREVVEIIRESFPELKEKLPPKDVPGQDYPEGGTYGFDNSRSKEVLGVEYRSLKDSIVDTVKSLLAVVGAARG
jgi:nucleoside-diphosphate-sugar epimerase